MLAAAYATGHGCHVAVGLATTMQYAALHLTLLLSLAMAIAFS
jgi:hypothetical protein